MMQRDEIQNDFLLQFMSLLNKAIGGTHADAAGFCGSGKHVWLGRRTTTLLAESFCPPHHSRGLTQHSFLLKSLRRSVTFQNTSEVYRMNGTEPCKATLTGQGTVSG